MPGKVGGKKVALQRPAPAKAVVPPTTPKGYTNTLKFFRENVVEIVFVRKTPLKEKKPGHLRKTRRMLCTANWRFIRSPIVARLYGFKKPKTRRGAAWYQKRNLLIVWDIMKAEFRIISLKKWKLVAYVPTQTLLDRGRFTAFYKQKIRGNMFQAVVYQLLITVGLINFKFSRSLGALADPGGGKSGRQGQMPPQRPKFMNRIERKLNTFL